MPVKGRNIIIKKKKARFPRLQLPESRVVYYFTVRRTIGDLPSRFGSSRESVPRLRGNTSLSEESIGSSRERKKHDIQSGR
jgi:hypothetical protein